MHTLLLVLVTSGLVLFQTTVGLTAHLEPDADFLEDAVAEGFIVSTEEPTKTEKPQDHNNNGIITHDSLNQEASQSQFQKDSLPTGTIAKTPEASPKLTGENTKELPKNESAAVLNTAGARKNTAPTSEENAEGSGILSEEVDPTMENAAAVDIESERSDLSFKTLNEKQDEANLFDGSGMEPEVSPTPTPTIIDETNAKVVENENNVEAKQPLGRSNAVSEKPVVFQGKESRKLVPGHDGQAERVKEGTPGWLIILALCLTLAAVICVFVAIGTKDMWYGPSRQCLTGNSTGSNKHAEYNKAATLPLSEKERMALMSAQKKETQGSECSISLEESPEKEYLM